MSADELLGDLHRWVERIEANVAEQTALATEDREMLKAMFAAQKRREQWMTTDEVAEWLQVSPDCVRRNADALGAGRVGDGKRSHLRFRQSRVIEEMEKGLPNGALRSVPIPISPPPRKRKTETTGVTLLPVGGKAA